MAESVTSTSTTSATQPIIDSSKQSDKAAEHGKKAKAEKDKARSLLSGTGEAIKHLGNASYEGVRAGGHKTAALLGKVPSNTAAAYRWTAHKSAIGQAHLEHRLGGVGRSPLSSPLAWGTGFAAATAAWAACNYFNVGTAALAFGFSATGLLMVGAGLCAAGAVGSVIWRAATKPAPTTAEATNLRTSLETKRAADEKRLTDATAAKQAAKQAEEAVAEGERSERLKAQKEHVKAATAETAAKYSLAETSKRLELAQAGEAAAIEHAKQVAAAAEKKKTAGEVKESVGTSNAADAEASKAQAEQTVADASQAAKDAEAQRKEATAVAKEGQQEQQEAEQLAAEAA